MSLVVALLLAVSAGAPPRVELPRSPDATVLEDADGCAVGLLVHLERLPGGPGDVLFDSGLPARGHLVVSENDGEVTFDFTTCSSCRRIMRRGFRGRLERLTPEQREQVAHHLLWLGPLSDAGAIRAWASTPAVLDQLDVIRAACAHGHSWTAGRRLWEEVRRRGDED